MFPLLRILGMMMVDARYASVVVEVVVNVQYDAVDDMVVNVQYDAVEEVDVRYASVVVVDVQYVVVEEVDVRYASVVVVDVQYVVVEEADSVVKTVPAVPLPRLSTPLLLLLLPIQVSSLLPLRPLPHLVTSLPLRPLPHLVTSLPLRLSTQVSSLPHCFCLH